MLEEREDYVAPVWFATEPAGERRKWISRIFLAAVVGLVGWLIFTRVFPPPQSGSPTEQPAPLPGPL